MTALQARWLIAVTALTGGAALAGWQAIPRQEDPSFLPRFASLSVPFPGAPAERVDALVVAPLEEELASVAELRRLDTTARPGLASFELRLADAVYDTDEAWEKVRRAVAVAQERLPEGTLPPTLDAEGSSPDAMVYAVSGSTDLRALRDGARTLRRALLQVPGVSRVRLDGDPGVQVAADIDDAVARRAGLSRQAVAAQLAGRSETIAGGSLPVGTFNAHIEPDTDLSTVEELRNTPILLASGAGIPLDAIATLRTEARTPAAPRAAFNGEDALFVVVVPEERVEVVGLGDDVRAAVDRERSGLAPLVVQEVSFQPQYVEARITSLLTSLLLGVAVVALVLLLLMGRRPALVVTLTVPAVATASFALWWIGGGVLHQISIAAFVIALGMVVDNAIVVVESIQSRLDHGADPREAAHAAVGELRVPLAVATVTTLGAFLPMLSAKGTTPDFVRALPLVLGLSLLASYVVAIWVTPPLAALVLRAKRLPGGHGRVDYKAGEGRFVRVGRALGRLAVRAPARVSATVFALLALTAASAVFVQQSFFPLADRDQLVIDLELRPGTRLEVTDERAAVVEAALRARSEVLSVATFVGFGGPRVYYSLRGKGAASNEARLLVRTRSPEDIPRLANWARGWLRREHRDMVAAVSPLSQGPPVRAPVVLEISGADLEARAVVAQRLLRILRRVPGAVDVRSDLDLGAPEVHVATVDAAAARRGVDRADIAYALLHRTQGVPVGVLRRGAEDEAIVLRSRRATDAPLLSLGTLGVPTLDGQVHPLGQIAHPTLGWAPSVIHRATGKRVVRVLAGVAPGASFDAVLRHIFAEIGEEALPPGIVITPGGHAKGAGEATTALLAALPIGLAVILLSLLWEFGSFRLVGLVLLTMPLAAAGVVPGLLLAGQPFGFMSLLGVVALAGVVVNNAIVLLDAVERERRLGRGLEEAVVSAVAQRTRPILLTTATTVAGLLPLAFSSSTLWPPLAWAMISGLIASTALTLLLVPAMLLLVGAPPIVSEPGSPRKESVFHRADETVPWIR